MMSIAILLSQTLLQDLELVVHPLPNGSHQQWESYKPLVTKLQQCIPSPLTCDELEHLDPFEEQEGGQSQLLLAHLYEELVLHNAALAGIHTSLQRVASFIDGLCSFSAELQCLFGSLVSGVLPERWSRLLWRTTDQSWLSLPHRLIPVIKVLRERTEFYVSSLHSGSAPQSISPLWLSNARGLLSKLAHNFAWEYQMRGDEVTLKCKVRM